MKAMYGILGVCLLIASMAFASQTKEINGQQYAVIGDDVKLVGDTVYDVWGNGGLMTPATPLGTQTSNELWTRTGACWRFNGQPPKEYSISGYMPYGYVFPPAGTAD